MTRAFLVVMKLHTENYARTLFVQWAIRFYLRWFFCSDSNLMIGCNTTKLSTYSVRGTRLWLYLLTLYNIYFSFVNMAPMVVEYILHRHKWISVLLNSQMKFMLSYSSVCRQRICVCANGTPSINSITEAPKWLSNETLSTRTINQCCINCPRKVFIIHQESTWKWKWISYGFWMVVTNGVAIGAGSLHRPPNKCCYI